MDLHQQDNLLSGQLHNNGYPQHDSCSHMITMAKGISFIQTEMDRMRKTMDYLTEIKSTSQVLHRYRPRHKGFKEVIEKINKTILAINDLLNNALNRGYCLKREEDCTVVISLPGGSYIPVDIPTNPFTLEQKSLHTREGIRTLEVYIDERMEQARTYYAYLKSQLLFLEKETISPNSSLHASGKKPSLRSIQKLAQEITIWTAQQILSSNDLAYTGEDTLDGQRVRILLSHSE